MKTAYKTSVVIRPYAVKAYGYDIVVPVGAKVSNQTACGCDDNYRFWVDFYKYAEKLTGFKNSILHHDLIHYGLNIPKEYCHGYQ